VGDAVSDNAAEISRPASQPARDIAARRAQHTPAGRPVGDADASACDPPRINPNPDDDAAQNSQHQVQCTPTGRRRGARLDRCRHVCARLHPAGRRARGAADPFGLLIDRSILQISCTDRLRLPAPFQRPGLAPAPPILGARFSQEELWAAIGQQGGAPAGRTRARDRDAAFPSRDARERRRPGPHPQIAASLSAPLGPRTPALDRAPGGGDASRDRDRAGLG
jgi:hypothetical protein